MKTYHLKDILKKELLIVELPRKADVEIFPNSIEIYNQFTGQEETIKGSYTLLGSPEEIKEDDVVDLVEKIGKCKFTWKSYNIEGYAYATAIDSFNSALESEIYWENPYGKEQIENLQSSTFGGEKTIIHRNPMNILWHEAESRTFDRNRTIIFYKKL